jgi:hypothetical protein
MAVIVLACTGTKKLKILLIYLYLQIHGIDAKRKERSTSYQRRVSQRRIKSTLFWLVKRLTKGNVRVMVTMAVLRGPYLLHLAMLLNGHVA